ncbi:50S ribosomal protein L23 [Thermithiobacillus plumbiphilus]|uniref:Large ribosomal subunit protein uL23 n=1 Tax=Thermithiobacillus plumbiphilus TaxID=1729899 RepID=A0ABU9DCQ5_9PROT
MNPERKYLVLRSPLISEKATRVAEKHNQFVFKVTTDATKLEIKKAVESLFEVKVKAVQTANCKGKVKRFGRHVGRRSDWKKAYVCLDADQNLELVSGA